MRLLLPVACLLLVGRGALAIEPAQEPLLTRSGALPAPNVMFTLDDSASMLSDFMPEGDFEVNGHRIRLEPLGARAWNKRDGRGRPQSYSVQHLALFPGDPRKTDPAGIDSPPTYQHGTVPAVKNIDMSADPVFQMQWRSPETNTLFYNPDMAYHPWWRPDGSGRRPAALPGAALWDPFSTALSPASLAIDRPAWRQTVWCSAPDRCDSTPAEPDGSFQWFHPGLVYRLQAGADPTLPLSFVRFDINANDGSHAPVVKAAGRSDCQASRCSREEEQRNFANWFTYYRMRESMTKAALSEVLLGFEGRIRAGWGRINKSVATPVDGSGLRFKVVESGIATLDRAQLTRVLTGLQSARSASTSPLRIAVDQVGAYFDQRSDAFSPWANLPGAPDGGRPGCRRSIHLLTTDGAYNDTYAAAGDLNNRDGGQVNSAYRYPVDPGRPGQNPGGFSPVEFLAVPPFTDDPARPVSNAFTDAAMRWFIRDLDPQSPNQVAPSDRDRAFWQHLSQSVLVLGARGTLDGSTPARQQATLRALADPSGRRQWPDPSVGTAEKIDDLWHATVATGGSFHPVAHAGDAIDALSVVVGAALGEAAAGSAVALSGVSLATPISKFVPQFNSGNWSGDLLAFDLGTDGHVLEAGPRWRAAEAEILRSPAQRRLFSWDGVAAVEFRLDQLDPLSRATLGQAGLVEYLRGGQADEGWRGAFRARGGNPLSDIVHGRPVHLGAAVDLGYGALSDPLQAGGYAAYLTARQARSQMAVMVGGNGGIFHGFRTSDGSEFFGYLPRAGLGHLPAFAAKNYGTAARPHRFVVDGLAVETDAWLAARGAEPAGWHQVVLGSLGSGGRAVFALSVPTDDPTRMDRQDVLWELADDPDLGHVIGDIRVGKVQGPGGAWVAFIGNGPGSPSQRGVLLVVDLATGQVLNRLVVPGATGNGLGGVRLLRNRAMEVVAAYVGDQQGRLWRFDFPGADPQRWRLGFMERPLFHAVTGSDGLDQPIVGAPAWLPHPLGGGVVLLGTGRLLTLADRDDRSVQTIYGIWDPTPLTESAIDRPGPFDDTDDGLAQRGWLQAQVIDVEHPLAGSRVDEQGRPVDSGERFFRLTQAAVDWRQHRGWLVDLDIEPGQKVLQAPQTLSTQLHVGAVLPPGPAPDCGAMSATGFNIVLDGLTGAAASAPVFDTNHDGIVDGSDGQAAIREAASNGLATLISAQSDVVDAAAPPRQCLPDVNARCRRPDACVVLVVNASDEAELICIDRLGPSERPGSCTGEGPCPKVIVDRAWRSLLNPPQP